MAVKPKINMQIEETVKDIKGYEGMYAISESGIVYSIKRKGKGFHNTGRVLKPYVNIGGYYMVSLYNNHKKKNYFIHRLIAEHFIDNPSNKPFINHKNGVRTDNRIYNLEWATMAENNAHAYSELKKVAAFSKLSKDQVYDIRELKLVFGYSNKYIAETFGVSKQTINRIVNQSTWRHI
jgi:hypothetical protein